MSSHQRVIVTYSGPLTFLQSDHWKQFHAALQSQLPLRNLHWKSSLRPSIRTIQELDLSLVALDSTRDEHTSQVPTTLLERPLLNVYIVICEDAETYKSSIRKQIKDWHSAVSLRKNQDWLIIHLLRPDARASSSGFFAVRASVLDKIKADFNTEKRDRCVQLLWSQGHDNPTAWAEVINKFKEGILSAFDAAVGQREEDVKRSENQRQMPGWNFCTFFILKESVAASFQGVNLHDEALAQYDELEVSFFQVLREKSLSWFGKLIELDPRDDNLPLLSLEKKPYRDMILANTISIFDFRVYLLGRQCNLLGKSGRVVEVARKTASFLSSFGQRLRDAENLPKFFIQSWIYSSSLSVIHQCDSWAAEFELDPPTANRFCAAKAELQELARRQLDTIGVAYGHLPSQPPFASTVSSKDASVPDDKDNLPAAFASAKDQDSFYDLYAATTNRAIELYAKATRKKFALKLHGDLAALDLHRGRLTNALQTYTSLPAHYSNYKWTSLESFMLSRQVSAREKLSKTNDREWVHTVLAYLKVFVENMDVPYSDHNVFEVRVLSAEARTAGTEDGLYVDATVKNLLPCDVTVDEISVFLAGRETERLKFSTASQILVPGTNPITLFCSTPSSGLHILDSSQVRLSRMILHWNHRQQDRASRIEPELPTLVKIPEDLQALDVQLHQPRRIELGSPQNLLMTISTGRNDVIRATLRLSTLSGVKFHTKQTVVNDKSASDLDVDDESITFSEISQDQVISIAIPHSDASSFQSMTVLVQLEYVTKSNATLVRSVQFARTAATALPLQVNVQDFFRGTQLLSRFTISTTSSQPLRVLSTELKLEGPGDTSSRVEIVGTQPRRRSVMTVTPAHPTNYLFQIKSPDGPVRQDLKLHLKFRTLEEEVESLVHRTVDEATMDSPSLHQQRQKMAKSLLNALREQPAWQDRYRVTYELDIPAGGNDPDDIKETLHRVRDTLRNGLLDAEGGQWREMIIPVEVPHMDILAAVRVQILPSPFSKEQPSPDTDKLPPLYAGQPISAELTIETSFHWGENADGQAYRMRFDVEELVRDWLVSGRKRGDFVAKNGGLYTVPITLIALHHGELPLPRVIVTPLPLEGETVMGATALPSTETHQVHGAEKVLILPRGGRSTFVVGMGGSQYV